MADSFSFVEEVLENTERQSGFEGPKLVPSQSVSKLRTVLLALLVVLFNAVGNLSLAVGMKSLPDTVGINPAGYLHAMLNPLVASGIALLILWLLTRMTLMSWADLSFALPLMAVGYVLAAVLGRFVLHETVTLRQWVGTALIFAGVAVVGTTTPKAGHGEAGLL